MESTSVVTLFGTVGAIVTTTIALVAILKRALGNVAGFRAIPVWVYACAIAGALTWVSHALGYLQGALPDLILSAILSAGAASGFRDWVTEGDLVNGLGDTTPAREARLDSRHGSGGWD